jgi:hypothetical protein
MEDDEEVEDSTKDSTDNTFYLWDINEEFMLMFKVLVNYIKKIYIQVNGTSHQIGYDLNEVILIELARNSSIDTNFILKTMPYVHSAYAIVLLENLKDT